MTGFEYTAAVGMLYEGQIQQGLDCIRNVRDRYDGRRRCPFDEAECGHHYARALASWAAVLALSGFHYSGVSQRIELAPRPGRWFWSNGDAYGVCTLASDGNAFHVAFTVEGGHLNLREFVLADFGTRAWPETQRLLTTARLEFQVARESSTGRDG